MLTKAILGLSVYVDAGLFAALAAGGVVKGARHRDATRTAVLCAPVGAGVEMLRAAAFLSCPRRRPPHRAQATDNSACSTLPLVSGPQKTAAATLRLANTVPISIGIANPECQLIAK